MLEFDFELDIPLLTDEGIQMKGRFIFEEVKELHSSSMLAFLLMIEMPILLINSFDSIVKN